MRGAFAAAGVGLAVAGGCAGGRKSDKEAWEMDTYKADVTPGGKGPALKVEIQSNSAANAKRLLEAQYGKGNVKFVLRK